MVRSVYGLVHLRTCNSLKVSSDPLPSINAVDFGWARLRGKQDQDPLSLLFQTHWLAQRNPGPTLGKKRKWLRQGLLEPLLGLPFLSYRLDVRSTFTFVFSSRSMQDSRHRRSLCVWVRMRVRVFKDRRAAPLLQTVSWLLSRSMECHFSWTRSQLRGQTIPQQTRSDIRLQSGAGPPRSFIILAALSSHLALHYVFVSKNSAFAHSARYPTLLGEFVIWWVRDNSESQTSNRTPSLRVNKLIMQEVL